MLWLSILLIGVVVSGSVVMVLEKKQKPSTISESTKYYLYCKQEKLLAHKRSEIR